MYPKCIQHDLRNETLNNIIRNNWRLIHVYQNRFHKFMFFWNIWKKTILYFGGLKFKFAVASTHIRVHIKQYSVISFFVTETNIPFAEINWNPDYRVFNTRTVPIVLTCHPLSIPSSSRNIIYRTPQCLCPTPY